MRGVRQFVGSALLISIWLEPTKTDNSILCMTSECRYKMCANQLRLRPDARAMKECLCAFDCSYEPDWLCSQDGYSYLNLCVLKSRACLFNTTINVKSSGQCPHGHRGSCAGVYCSLGTRCEINVEDQRPMCTCSTSCPFREGPAVCGSDGELYANECYMKALACRLGRHVSVVRYGRCRERPEPGPCSKRKCPGICEEYAPGKARCVCTKMCLPTQEPVCGSDRRTYRNKCELNLASCKTGRVINVVSTGPCPLTQVQCLKTTCVSDGVCVVRQGRISCLCIETCPNIRNTLCGADGKTYYNYCRLKLNACRLNTRIAIAHLGRCISDPCDEVRCGLGRKCFAVNEKAECQCHDDCKDENGTAICGSNGKTYMGECLMQYTACQMKMVLTVAHSGACGKPPERLLFTCTSFFDPCYSVSCPIGQYCAVKNNQSICVCQRHQQCPQEKNVVCGSDGKTYLNECVLKAKACNRKSNVTQISTGKCHTPTLQNPCEASGLSCQFYEECVITPKSKPQCRCPTFECPSEPDFVCGSNGATYRSSCSMKRKACKKRSVITEIRKGRC
eukprot:m.15050 g.15050  ORF g.15050 m.15050 type:complete len:563 (+) comp26139_c0_seq1:188-1876(+)